MVFSQDFDKPLGVVTYRLETEIPCLYTALIYVIDGVLKDILGK